jgi:hypothetical protein
VVNIGQNVDLEARCEYYHTALLPKSRVACFTHVEIDCAVGSNSRASSCACGQIESDLIVFVTVPPVFLYPVGLSDHSRALAPDVQRRQG